MRRAERTIRDISDTALVRLGEAFRAIRDGRLYRDTDASWTAYVERALGTTPQFVAALINGGGCTLSYQWSYHLQGGRKAHEEHVRREAELWRRMRALMQCPQCGYAGTRRDPQAAVEHCDQCGHAWPESAALAQAREAYYGRHRAEG